MTTFTRTPDAKTALIDVSRVRKISKIDDNIYGGFLEYVVFHLSQCSFSDGELWFDVDVRTLNARTRSAFDFGLLLHHVEIPILLVAWRNEHHMFWKENYVLRSSDTLKTFKSKCDYDELSWSRNAFWTRAGA